MHNAVPYWVTWKQAPVSSMELNQWREKMFLGTRQEGVAKLPPSCLRLHPLTATLLQGLPSSLEGLLRAGKAMHGCPGPQKAKT